MTTEPEYVLDIPDGMIWVHGYWRTITSGSRKGEKVWVAGHLRDVRR